MERLREGDLDVLSRQKWGERFMITITVPVAGGHVGLYIRFLFLGSHLCAALN